MRTRVRGTHCPGAASRAWASLPRGKASLAGGSQANQGSRAWDSTAPAAPAGEGVRPAAAWDLLGAEALGHQEAAGMDTSVLQIGHERQGTEKSSSHSPVGQEAVSSPSDRTSFVT